MAGHYSAGAYSVVALVAVASDWSAAFLGSLGASGCSVAAAAACSAVALLGHPALAPAASTPASAFVAAAAFADWTASIWCPSQAAPEALAFGASVWRAAAGPACRPVVSHAAAADVAENA